MSHEASFPASPHEVLVHASNALILERDQLADQLRKCAAALDAERAALESCRADLARVTAERDEAVRSNERVTEAVRGATTLASCGAAVLSAHLEYSVGTMLPALVAAAATRLGLG